MKMIKVKDNSEELGKAFNRVMREKNKDGHLFKSMNISNMEHICDICYMPHA